LLVIIAFILSEVRNARSANFTVGRFALTQLCANRPTAPTRRCYAGVQ
jgi:hypothetical protein